MFRWGILSTAKIAREHVIPAIQASENGIVHALASRDPARAAETARRSGIPNAFGSYEDLLASPDIDGVYIPLPTSQHVEWACRAAEAGKHVLVEKPLALTASDIGAVMAARDRASVTVSEAFMVTYHPQWLKVRELLAQGVIGRLRQVQGAFTYYNVDPANMRNILALGGGGLADIGVYPTVTTRFATGLEPSEVRADIRRDPAFGTDTYASVSARFEGFELSFYVATQMAARQSMVFHGDEGFIEVHTPFNAGLYGHHLLTIHNRLHTEATSYSFAGAQQYRLQVEAFVRAARGEGEGVFSLEDSLKNQKVIDAIVGAASAGGWVAV